MPPFLTSLVLLSVLVVLLPLLKTEIQGYLAHKKTPAPLDHHRALGIGLLQGPRGKRFIMSEVPLYCTPKVSNVW